MSLFGALTAASQSLLSQKVGITTTNRNINNVYTDGYSRETPVFADLPGLGVQVETVKRIFNRAYFKRLLSENGDNAQLSAYKNILSQIESLFNDPMGSGISDILNQFFNSLHDVAVKPDDISARASFLSVAKTLVGRIRDTYSSLKEIETTSISHLKDVVSQVNRLTERLAEINKNMLLFKDSPERFNQYLDERDRTLKELSSLVDVKVVYLPDERVRVYTAKGFSLVLENRNFNLSVDQDSSGVKVLANGVDITDDLGKGEIGGTVKGLKTVVEFKDKLNTLVSTFAQKINQQHEAGYDLDGNTGNALFISDNGQPIDASNIELAFEDPRKVAAASDPNYLNSDNTNVKDLISLGEQTFSELSDMSFAEFYGTEIASSIGAKTKSVDDLLKASQFRLESIEEKIKELSGVNMDEELVNLTRYQRAYQAAARVVTVTDELLQTVLGMVR